MRGMSSGKQIRAVHTVMPSRTCTILFSACKMRPHPISETYAPIIWPHGISIPLFTSGYPCLVSILIWHADAAAPGQHTPRSGATLEWRYRAAPGAARATDPSGPWAYFFAPTSIRKTELFSDAVHQGRIRSAYSRWESSTFLKKGSLL